MAAGSLGARLRSGELLHLGRAARTGCLEAWLPTSVLGLLAAGDEGMRVARAVVRRVEEADVDQREALRSAGALINAASRLQSPIPRPGLILAAGLAYRSHLEEMSGTPRPVHPTAFLKAPSSVCGPGHEVHLPPQAPRCVDYEGELACVFGKVCHDVTEADALSYLAGYTAANDVSARDWVKPVWAATAPWEARLTWEVNLMGKQLPGFTPLGPVLTTVDEVPDPEALRLVTRLNGNTMQSAPVSDLLFSIPCMIAHFSRWYTFQPGDVLLTGTPAGVGVGRKPPLFMEHGDVVEVEIDRIGILKSRFVVSGARH